ncbi:MAG: hypothetical protein LBG18_06335 [Mediterranea sp.]|jgi:hypothetical protein|nr:hypothetical protein [Mediterranea sp.]
MRNIKQALIWLKRFPYRCGYGVHSPFAFNFITNVIYERTPYYAYRELENEKRAGRMSKERESCRSKKVNRLLFRLVNWAQPLTVVDSGCSQITSGYLRAARRGAEYIPLVSMDTIGLLRERSIDFLYIDRPEDIAFMENLFEYGVERVGDRSMIVIWDIYHSTATKAFWKQVTADERVGITFDLYYLGILFFDKSKIKQHYTVNF